MTLIYDFTTVQNGNLQKLYKTIISLKPIPHFPIFVKQPAITHLIWAKKHFEKKRQIKNTAHERTCFEHRLD